MKPTKKQIQEALEKYKAEPVTVEHNCYIRVDALQPTDMKGIRGHCTQCKHYWIKKFNSLGWEPH